MSYPVLRGRTKPETPLKGVSGSFICHAVAFLEGKEGRFPLDFFANCYKPFRSVKKRSTNSRFL